MPQLNRDRQDSVHWIVQLSNGKSSQQLSIGWPFLLPSMFFGEKETPEPLGMRPERLFFWQSRSMLLLETSSVPWRGWMGISRIFGYKDPGHFLHLSLTRSSPCMGCLIFLFVLFVCLIVLMAGFIALCRVWCMPLRAWTPLLCLFSTHYICPKNKIK